LDWVRVTTRVFFLCVRGGGEGKEKMVEIVVKYARGGRTGLRYNNTKKKAAESGFVFIANKRERNRGNDKRHCPG